MKHTLILVAAAASLAGCASSFTTLNKDLITGQCITAVTGSLSVTNSLGDTIFTKASETLVFCPPRIIATQATVVAAPASAASGAAK
jgi:hypothetical protein